MTRRRYSKTEKARVVADALNSSTEAASERAGIPRSTVRYWLDQPEFASLRHETREAVAEQFWAAIQVGLKEVANGLRDPDTALRDKSVALGILYDKHALLTGGATNRSESRDITGSISDADLVAAVREAERLTGEGRAAPATEGEAAG
jgi:transposase-like protein